MVKEKDTTLSSTFIVKPDGGSQGDGIYLIRDPSELKVPVGSQARQGVVQEYIHKPLLIDKLKFDIRLYVLMKSLEPLEIYIAKEGLTRFCTEPYQAGYRGLRGSFKGCASNNEGVSFFCYYRNRARRT